ncbi:MAG: hypothetical protein ACTHOR_01740 [Devosia sp.]
MTTLAPNPARITELRALRAQADEDGADHYELNGMLDAHEATDWYKAAWDAGWTPGAPSDEQSPRYLQWRDGYDAEMKRIRRAA